MAPRWSRTPLGLSLTPSAVSLDDHGEVLVGLAAREPLSTAPDRSAAAFRRYVGTDRRFNLGGKPSALGAVFFCAPFAEGGCRSLLGCAVGEAIVTAGQQAIEHSLHLPPVRAP